MKPNYKQIILTFLLGLILFLAFIMLFASFANAQNPENSFKSQFRQKPSAGEIISVGGAALVGISWFGILNQHSTIYDQGIIRVKSDTSLSVATAYIGGLMMIGGIWLDINCEGKRKKNWTKNISASSEGLGLKLKF
jgi:hypothetical protein